ncbi:MAG: DAK2 domain-containing protein [Micrococcales bacterium]|nr:DAK2 domain-containing protein [Micrococcales bacterium]
MAARVRLDAALVRAWAAAAVQRLRDVAPRIDALNVFPVADADTGQNVVCTLAGGLAAVETSPTDDLSATAHLLATGALREARGSSGVIVSGWFAGLAVGLVEDAPGEPTRLAGALASAAVGARQAVADPWPGTVLEVADQVAATVRRQAADPHLPLADLLPGPLDAVRARLAETSAHHPVLRSAGVVDAGACALLVVLEVLAALLAAEPPDRAGAWLPPPSSRPEPGPEPSGSGGAFEVMLHVTVEVDLTRLASTGAAAAVTGLGDQWRTHVHTDDPVTALALVAPDELRIGLVRAVTGGAAGVVVTADTGLAAWYAAAGAAVVVPGGAASPDDLRAVVSLVGGGLSGDRGHDGTGRYTLATDPELAAQVGAMTADPVRAAVACTALDEQADVEAALRRVRTAQTDDADPTAALTRLLAGSAEPGEVLTVVPRTGFDPAGVRALAAAHGLELVLVGPATTGPVWRLGVD